jgi:hypothetical protein
MTDDIPVGCTEDGCDGIVRLAKSAYEDAGDSLIDCSNKGSRPIGGVAARPGAIRSPLDLLEARISPVHPRRNGLTCAHSRSRRLQD